MGKRPRQPSTPTGDTPTQKSSRASSSRESSVSRRSLFGKRERWTPAEDLRLLSAVERISPFVWPTQERARQSWDMVALDFTSRSGNRKNILIMHVSCSDCVNFLQEMRAFQES